MLGTRVENIMVKMQIHYLGSGFEVHLAYRTTAEEISELFGGSICFQQQTRLAQSHPHQGRSLHGWLRLPRIGYLLPADILMGLYVISYLIAARPARPRRSIRSMHTPV